MAADSERLMPESAFFRGFVSRGHLAGKENHGIWQGTYVVAPGGELLGSTGSHDPREVERVLRQALARWSAPQADGGALDAPLPASPTLAHRNGLRPADGLQLVVYGRDLRSVDGGYAPLRDWNLDLAWFRRDEAAQWVPAQPKVGAETPVPGAVVQRLARFNFIDMVRGFNAGMHVGVSPAYPPDEVKAAVEARVEAVDGPRVRLSFHGHSHAVTRRLHPARGIDLTWTGDATFDTARGRFTAFELAAVGERWGPSGAAPFNDRPPERSAIGFWAQLAGDEPAAQLAPVFLDAYGWR